jgi:hypothetical protein
LDTKKDVDLAPHEWETRMVDGSKPPPKPREPFFGPGAPGMLLYVIGFAVTFTAVYLIRGH